MSILQKNAFNENARLALDTLNRLPTRGIPTGLTHIMEHSVIEHLAGVERGAYVRDPHGVYVQMQKNIGVCMIDQYLADNPLTIGDHGYESARPGGAPVGAVERDGILIDSPEAVVEHIERFVIPRMEEKTRVFDFEADEEAAIRSEQDCQRWLGPDILKTGYAHLTFPTLTYTAYGYENYFSAFALYPEVMGRLFAAQADYAELHNRAVASGFVKAGLPLYMRLDHDMADSRGLLTGLPALERDWLPCFDRSIRPAVEAGFALVWHCDGNLMELIPPLLECGVNGFQGFQYEDGMDYVKICGMRDRNGNSLLIEAGVSVTRELPMGTPTDVRRQVDFLVEHGPKTGLFLQFSSSCVPGTPLVNIEAALDAMRRYRKKR
ncbi:MAG: hypothetical protein FWF96_04495 [Kiritimatiellaeota bacterium]|nr:hypothetical protein [Kiritimatiellota bacterium]